MAHQRAEDAPGTPPAPAAGERVAGPAARKGRAAGRTPGGVYGKARTPRHIKDLRPDPANRRQRTPRNAAMIAESLRTVGAARSIVIDERNEVLAGNGVLEAAADVGVTKVQVVDADGQTIIAVRRRGLDAAQKRAIALYDNRSAELAEWNPEQIGADAKQGLDLQPFFTDNELRSLLKTSTQATVEEVDTSTVADRFWIHVRGPLPQQAAVLQRLRELLREVEGVVIELGTIADLEPW